MSDFTLLNLAASGMQAQREELNVAARNVAAAQAAGPGGSYEREVADFRTALDGDDPQITFTGTHLERGSDVDMLAEMVAVMNASRAYEANASVFDLGKRLAERTIDMGRL